jgi:hypothetical protein
MISGRNQILLIPLVDLLYGIIPVGENMTNLLGQFPRSYIVQTGKPIITGRLRGNT